MLAVYDEAGHLAAEYAYAGGEHLAVLKPGDPVEYYLSDHLSSARRLYSGSGSGNTYWAADYYPYGEVEAQTGSEGESRFGFTGHETDFATDLIYMGCLDPWFRSHLLS